MLVGLCSILGTGYATQVFAASSKENVAAVQQTKKVTGRVSDANGPLIGATVMVKGTTNGSVTDLDGNYSINAKAGAILIVSYVGYVTQEVNIGNAANINVILKEEGRNIGEIVVIGYGTQRKESVTGSVASVKGDLVREIPGSDITNAMQGRVAGVEMAQTSSKPGASMQIRIRGTRSLNASNDPLIVLDGIPFAGSINDIDPNNIKSMDILKDASATAIYGSRGANGVIIITTYRGIKEQKATVSLNSYIGVKTLFAKYPMMNAEKFSAMRTYANKYQNGVDESDEGVDTDWQNLLFRNGITTNQDVSVNGGTEKSSYNFGISYYRDESPIPLQNYNRYAMRAAIDQELGNFVKIGFNTTTNFSITNGQSLGLYNTLSSTPIANPYNSDGSWKTRIQMSSDTQWAFSQDALESLGDKYKDQDRALGTYNSFYGEVKCPWVEGLKYRINLGLNYRHSEYGNYTGQGVFASDDTTESHASVTNTTTTNWAIENMLTYDKTFGKNSINAVLLYSAEQSKYTQSYIYAKDIPSDAFQYYNLGQAASQIIDPAKQDYYKSGLMSWPCLGRKIKVRNDSPLTFRQTELNKNNLGARPKNRYRIGRSSAKKISASAVPPKAKPRRRRDTGSEPTVPDKYSKKLAVISIGRPKIPLNITARKAGGEDS